MDDIQLSSILPVEAVPMEKLPSSTRAFTGYVSTDILNKHYHLCRPGARSWMVCPTTCTGRVPRCIPHPEANSHVKVFHKNEAIFATLDIQPGFPIIPGQPGIMLATHPPHSASATTPSELDFALFVGPSTDQKEWLYLGQYTWATGNKVLSSRGWRGLPDQVRDKWVQTLASYSHKFPHPFWHIDRPCLVMLVRIALRKRNLPLEHAEDMCTALSRCSWRTAPDLDISKDDIRQALDTGSERLNIVKLVPTSFNKEWYLELQDLASGELVQNPRCDGLFREPRWRPRHLFPQKSAPRPLTFEKVYHRLPNK